MATYDDLAKRLNDAAQQKQNIAKDLLTVVEEFTRQVERVWQSGGKIEFGRLADDGTYVAGQIGAPNDGQIAEFVIAGLSGSGSVRNVQESKFGVNLLFEVKMFLGKSGTLKEMIHSVH